MAKTCPYCKPDARGHHAKGCPNRGKNSFVPIGEVIAGLKITKKDAKKDQDD